MHCAIRFVNALNSWWLLIWYAMSVFERKCTEWFARKLCIYEWILSLNIEIVGSERSQWRMLLFASCENSSCIAPFENILIIFIATIRIQSIMNVILRLLSARLVGVSQWAMNILLSSDWLESWAKWSWNEPPWTMEIKAPKHYRNEIKQRKWHKS